MLSRFFVTDTDLIYLQMSFDGGQNWINITTFCSPGVAGAVPYLTAAVDINKLKSKDLKVKSRDKPVRLISLEREE